MKKKKNNYFWGNQLQFKFIIIFRQIVYCVLAAVAIVRVAAKCN